MSTMSCGNTEPGAITEGGHDEATEWRFQLLAVVGVLRVKPLSPSSNWRLDLCLAGLIINLTHLLRRTQPPAFKDPTSARQLCVRNIQLYSKPSCWTSPVSDRMSIIQDLETQHQVPSGRGYSLNDTLGCFDCFEDELGIVNGEGSVGRRHCFE